MTCRRACKLFGFSAPLFTSSGRFGVQSSSHQKVLFFFSSVREETMAAQSSVLPWAFAKAWLLRVCGGVSCLASAGVFLVMSALQVALSGGRQVGIVFLTAPRIRKVESCETWHNSIQPNVFRVGFNLCTYKEHCFPAHG